MLNPPYGCWGARVRPGQSLTHIQNLDTDDAAALVKIQNDPWAHLLRLDNRRFLQPDVERIGCLIRPHSHGIGFPLEARRSKNTVMTRYSVPAS